MPTSRRRNREAVPSLWDLRLAETTPLVCLESNSSSKTPPSIAQRLASRPPALLGGLQKEGGFLLTIAAENTVLPSMRQGNAGESIRALSRHTEELYRELTEH